MPRWRRKVRILLKVSIPPVVFKWEGLAQVADKSENGVAGLLWSDCIRIQVVLGSLGPRLGHLVKAEAPAGSHGAHRRQ